MDDRTREARDLIASLHTIVYLKGVQPWRTATFGIGVLSMIAMVVLGAMALFR